MKAKLSLFMITAISFTIVFNCAHKKAYKKALELEKAGHYVEAAEKDLEALEKKSDFEEAQKHLEFVAPEAYKELLNQAELQEGNFQWLEALDTWDHMDLLLNRFKRHGIFLKTVDVDQRSQAARNTGMNYYYSSAEGHYQSGNYVQAILNYKNVHQITGYFRDTKDKLWQSHVKLGDQKLASREYNSAVSLYQAALDYAANVNRTNQYVAEAYYQWAGYLSNNQDYRGATEKYESVMQIIPNYRDVQRRHRQVYEEAVQRVAIMPFKNSSSQGNHYCNVLTEELTNNCIKSNLKYASFMTRSHLDQILDEHKLAMSGLVDASKAAEIGRLEGIDYFVTGHVTQISQQNSPVSSVEKIHERVYTAKDSAGNDMQMTETIRYREFKKSRTVRISVSFQIVEVQTGRYVSGENFNRNIIDEVYWVRYKGSLTDLPKEKQKLVSAPPPLKTGDILISDGMRKIAAEMGQEVVTFLK